MYEYVFFHRQLAEEFLTAARQYDQQAQLVWQDPAWEVHVSESINDEDEATLASRYDTLFDQDRDRYEAGQQPENGYHAASVELSLSNGQNVYAQVDPRIMDKVTNALSHEELMRLLSDIVFAVENPDERSICQRYRDQTKRP